MAQRDTADAELKREFVDEALRFYKRANREAEREDADFQLRDTLARRYGYPAPRRRKVRA